MSNEKLNDVNVIKFLMRQYVHDYLWEYYGSAYVLSRKFNISADKFTTVINENDMSGFTDAEIFMLFGHITNLDSEIIARANKPVEEDAETGVEESHDVIEVHVEESDENGKLDKSEIVLQARELSARLWNKSLLIGEVGIADTHDGIDIGNERDVYLVEDDVSSNRVKRAVEIFVRAYYAGAAQQARDLNGI